RVMSAHFTVYSDLPVAEIEHQTRKLEQLLAAFLKHGWDTHGELPLYVNVVMLRDHSQFHELAGDEVAGYATARVIFEPWLVVPAPTRSEEFQVVSHELTHYLSRQVMPYQPRWFSEGLATYFETAQLDREEFTLGRIHKSRLASVKAEGLLGLDILFDDSSDHLNGRYYGSAWLLVHYLMTEHPAAFAKYQVELARGQAHEQAWSTAFPTVLKPQLEQWLAQYLRRGQFANFSFPSELVAVPTRSEALRQADEEALWATLWTTARTDRTTAKHKVKEHLARALLLDPDQEQAVALSLYTVGRSPEALERARRLASRHPSSWLAWLTLGYVLWYNGIDDRMHPSPAERALALAPRQPFAWMLRAVELMQRGDRAGALSSSKQALRLQPSNDEILLLRASLLAKLGECQQLKNVVRTIRQVRHARLSAREQAALDKVVGGCVSPP
ncbi:MAG: hypothetical protein JWN04_5592, partial [Myxococcaceae bacterium]|nr:hypothetical protein [Myxococcaceae bacterium]